MKKIIVFVLVIILMITYGCTPKHKKDLQADDENDHSNNIPISPELSEDEIEVTLYFADDSFNYLVPEQRVIKKDDDVLEQIVGQLLKGPYQPEKKKLFDEEVKVLSTAEIDGVAFVDFNQTFMDMLTGKLAQEGQEEKVDKEELKRKNELAIYSIVNSLTETEGVERVNFLVNGDVIKSDITDFNLENKLSRDKDYILNPQKLVEEYFKEIAAKNWEQAYKYVYTNIDENDIITYEQFVVNANKKDAVLVKYEVNDYEILNTGDKALVSVDYEIKFNDDTDIHREEQLISVVKVDDIWKVKWLFPPENW
ncbi:MAG: GerMN domain-containing protein [Clostridia bacterium]|nr:GerMN domain-containing protein [Clostridia bacterium]